MNVRVEIQFDQLDEEAWDTMRSLAGSLTKNPQSVRVFVRDEPSGWLVVEFTMPTEAQYKAVDRIDRVLRLCAWNRLDSIIRFPKSQAEVERSRRRAERRRAKRPAADAKRFTDEETR